MPSGSRKVISGVSAAPAGAAGRCSAGGPQPQAPLDAVVGERFHCLVRVEPLDSEAEVVSAAGPLAQRDELRAGPDGQDRHRAHGLGHPVGESEHPLVVRQGALQVGDRNRDVVQRARRERGLAPRRRLRDAAQLAEGAGPAAVAGVLDLEQHAVGIVEDQLGRVRGVHHHRPLGRRRPQVVAPAVVGPGEDARLDPQLGELLHHALRVEVLHVHAEVVAHAAARARPPLAQRDELRPGPDRHDRQVAAVLAREHRQVEQALVEVERALDVGHPDGDVVQVQDRERRRLRLRPQPGPGQQRGRRRHEVAPRELQRHQGHDCHAARGKNAMIPGARIQRMLQRQKCNGQPTPEDGQPRG